MQYQVKQERSGGGREVRSGSGARHDEARAEHAPATLFGTVPLTRDARAPTTQVAFTIASSDLNNIHT